jgi:putative DNA primase/helicase
MDAVTLEQLQALAATLPKEEPSTGQRNGQASDFDLEGFIARHLEVHHDGAWSNGGYRWILKGCPFNSDHAELSAYVARRSGGAIVAGCQHYSCTWGWAELRAKFEPKPETKAKTKAKAKAKTDPPRGVFYPAPLGRALRARGHLRMGEDGRLWRYNGGVYRPDGDAWLVEQIRDMLAGNYKRADKAEIVDWVRAEQPTIRVGADTGTINVRNGLLDWRTGELRPHTPEEPSAVQLPVTYDPAARCRTILRFLLDVLPPDALRFVIELVGWLLVPDPRYRKAVLLLGSGRNGKSTFLAALRRLLGASNVASIPLQAFAEDRFAAAELYGKLANLCGDLDARALGRSDLFKQIVGGVDTISAQRKYGHPFEFVPHARLVFSANEAPGTSDQTDAYFDRWLVVPFPRRFSEEEADPTLLRRLVIDTELSGLLNLALRGLRRLDARGRFNEPDSVRKAGIGYREKADTIAGFLEEACVIEPGAWVPRAALYRAYRRWCEGSGRWAVSAARFNEHLRTRPAELSETTHRGQRRWLGIGMRGAADDDIREPWWAE